MIKIILGDNLNDATETTIRTSGNIPIVSILVGAFMMGGTAFLVKSNQDNAKAQDLAMQQQAEQFKEAIKESSEKTSESMKELSKVVTRSTEALIRIEERSKLVDTRFEEGDRRTGVIEERSIRNARDVLMIKSKLNL